MKLASRKTLAFILSVSAAGCGGGGSDSPAGPNPAPTATPAPQSTPKPTPTPTPDPRINLAPGPVVRFTHKPRIAGPEVREAELDGQGRYVVFVGERVDFDGTQKNANNEICKWVNEPVWMVNGRQMAFDSSNGVVTRRGSSQPFLLKLTIDATGTFSVQGEIDGVASNVLEIKAVKR
jgi:hypothetical protein